MQNMNWNYPTTIWFGENRYKDIQDINSEIGLQRLTDITKNMKLGIYIVIYLFEAEN